MAQCLIVDDEKILADLVQEYFAMFGVDAVCAYSAGEALSENFSPKVVLLDVNLPDSTGYELCGEMRRKYPDAKLYFLSARQEDFDILKGYAVGGDDYIIKPVSLPVLLAKVKKALGERGKEERYRNFVIDKEAMRVTKDGADIVLKPMEFKLFYYLFQHRGEVVRKDDLIVAVWGDEYYASNTLNVHMNRLREKLGEDLIVTIWSVGFRMEKA